MAFKSQAQRKRMRELEAAGKIPEGTCARQEQETGDRELPERVAKRNSKARSARRGKIWPT